MKQITKQDAINLLIKYYSKFPNLQNPMKFFDNFFNDWKERDEGYVYESGKIELYKGSQYHSEIQYKLKEIK